MHTDFRNLQQPYLKYITKLRSLKYFIGLLIEPSLEYPKLLKRNRKVTSVNACMATKNYPHVVEFYSYKGIGGIKGNIAIVTI